MLKSDVRWDSISLHYDPFEEPNPKYFAEILENSLPESQIGLFCENFLRLLKFNQKKHKEKVACLVGNADSGKKSLFYPILGVSFTTAM